MTDEDFPVLKKTYRVTMPDDSVWAVPVSEIAMNRADHYIGEYDGDLIKSLYEDTLPLFQENENEIGDWARGNMDWSDVASVAVRLETPDGTKRYANGWVNPEKSEVK